MQKDDEQKIDFQTKYSYFEYLLILFDISNILTSFWAYTNEILVKKTQHFYCYILE